MSGSWRRSGMLITEEVAALFGVCGKTVQAWARSGRLPSITTPTGYRRYRAEVVRAALAAAGRSGARQ